MQRGKGDKFTKEENFDLSLPHPFTIIKYLSIFIVVFIWYKFVTKTDILDMFYNKVVDCPKIECPKIDCSSCPTEKEVIIGRCKPCDTGCKLCEEKVYLPCNLKCNNNQCPDPKPCPVCPICEKDKEKEKFDLEK